MIILFLDTNIYLHAKPVQDIPWRDLLDDDVQILIPRITVQELDEQKDTNTKQATRDRARKALHQIETWTTPTTLRKGVTITYHHDGPNQLPDGLRRERNDDVLIATILYYKEQHPTANVILISNDTGARLNARHHRITANELEAQHLQESTPDPLEVENKRLKKQVLELTSASPQLHLTLNSEPQTTTTRPLNPPPSALDETSIATAAANARHQLPSFTRTNEPEPTNSFHRVNGKLALDLSRHSPFSPEAISNSEYDRYTADCATYEDDYRKYLSRHHDIQLVRSRTVKLDVTLHNTGGKPAQDITIDIQFPDHLTISTHAPVAGGPPRKPTPPRSTGALLSESLQRGLGIENYAPNFMPDINPAQRGPWIKQHYISWWVRSLKHDFQRDLDAIYLTIDGKFQPFEATVTIHAANSIKTSTARIIIKPKSDTGLDDR